MRVAITGAASGIGAASAALLKQRGAEIIGFDIAEPTANVDRWIQTDMSDPASISNAISQVDGSFDALLSIAGLPPRDGLTQKILQVNFVGLVSFFNAIKDHLNPGASIVNLASRAGWQWRENLEEVKALIEIDGWDDAALAEFINSRSMDSTRAYNLSKEAVIVWSMSCTEELLSRDMRVNCVSPSAVATGILDDFMKAFGDRAIQSVARAGRAGSAEEIAQLVAFLAHPDSYWIKGNDILIDGGMSAMATSDALGLTK